MGPGAKSGPGSYQGPVGALPGSAGGVGGGGGSNRASAMYGGGGMGSGNSGDLNSFSWEVWDCIRTVCGYHPRLSLGEFDGFRRGRTR